MRITRRQLRRIINEEFRRVLSEQAGSLTRADLHGASDVMFAVDNERKALASLHSLASDAFGTEFCAAAGGGGMLGGRIRCPVQPLDIFDIDPNTSLAQWLRDHPETVDKALNFNDGENPLITNRWVASLQGQEQGPAMAKPAP